MSTSINRIGEPITPGIENPGAKTPGAQPRGSERQNEGHGRRLTAAFEALEAFPALVESRNRVLRLFEAAEPQSADIVAAIEADVALAVTVMRLANQVTGRPPEGVESLVAAVQVLSPPAVRAIATHARTFDFFERTSVWQGVPERFRLHAVATQRAADRLALELGYRQRERLAVTSLLHDIGKLVLIQAYPGYPRQIHGEARTPEERLARERVELGVDHALVGGVLARRWGLPATLAAVIERHHTADAGEEAGIVRLADMLAHYALDGQVTPSEMLEVSGAAGVKPAALRAVMYDLPLPSASPRPREPGGCPMSARELEVLRRLAKGMVYKQIANDLGLSTSTVRSHLHKVYGKLGAVDRAQAVLIAAEHGWI